MDTSFYTAVRGAMTQQSHMDVLSNNIANINTTGYKTKNGMFQHLMYYNLHAGEDADVKRQAGTGAVLQRTDIDFTESPVMKTSGAWDFAIDGTGFFALRDPQNNEISYTRAGDFKICQRQDGFYLTDTQGRFVLDASGNVIRYNSGKLSADPAVYDFRSTVGMLGVGDNRYVPTEKNGRAFLAESTKLVKGVLETSNVDLASELAKVIESSRAYAYILKMVQTSDEVEQTINSLR